MAAIDFVNVLNEFRATKKESGLSVSFSVIWLPCQQINKHNENVLEGG